MNKICGIYKIKNKINNKVYIGRTINIINRWKNGHIKPLNKNKHKNDYLQRAWNKYGEDNFEFSIIEECKREQTGDREKYWIAYYKSSNPIYGYNLTEGGDGGEIPNEQTRKKISNTKKEYFSLKENKLKLSAQSKKNWKNEDYCIKMGVIISNNMKIKWSDSEYKKNTGEKIKQSLNTPECKQKLSDHSKANWANPEYRENMINKIHEFSSTEDFKNKCSKNSLKMWENEEHRNKVKQELKKTWSNPELRKRQSKSRKEYLKNKENKIKLTNSIQKRFKKEKLIKDSKCIVKIKMFTKEQKLNICNKFESGESATVIASYYKCSIQSIKRIENNNFSKEEIKLFRRNKVRKEIIRNNFTDKQIKEICNLIENKKSIREISRIFNCERNLINYIKDEYFKDLNLN